MFIRRCFYDLSTGEIFYGYMMSGAIRILPIEQEFKVNQALNGRTTEDTGVFEWTEPDQEIEEKFKGYHYISVDISVSPNALIFTEKPEPEPTPETEQAATVEDYEAALKELGV